MKQRLLLSAIAVLGLFLLGAASTDDKPQYTSDNKLVRPENYRDWMYLSSGLGMNYNPKAGGHDMFTNVFVPRWAYDEFVKTGKWPDKTTFVVEERGAESVGSINKHGHYQTTDLMGLGVEVKDSRFPEKWVYFGFDNEKSAAANPKEACFNCHEKNAAVEHSFVQFYPTLKPVAQKFGVYREGTEKVEGTEK